MQLKKIKLSGFKSFVDPTTVPIPSNLVAIVGPNGCGKSNIIDAVCWVMGESSAKYLRGESLTDVIFNGSSARKPVGQASVELVFDNQDGSLGGEYASYAEISIRRVINRDSESTYFLNGTRCRRRDIIDIFLGTGLGPRSYSIIGQNMISRLIEAKPDDMRVYLEEAAGISKYKERRRETENRINHTKDNLARLNDIRMELEKQLGSLKRQAGTAEKFKLLKQEERVLRAKWLAAQWRQFDRKLIQLTLHIQQQETGLEAKQAELGEINLNTEREREDQRLANEAFQDVQRRYYLAGNDITRIEQDILHMQERQRQWQHDVRQAENDWAQAKNNLEEAEGDLGEFTHEMQHLEPKLEEAIASTDAAVQAYDDAEEAMQTWQNRWDAFNQSAARATQTAQVEQTRITHLEQQLATLKQRQIKLTQDQGQLDYSQLDNEIKELVEQVSELSELSDEHNSQLVAVRQEITAAQSTEQSVAKQLDEVRNKVQRLRGQQASLDALQQTALGQRNNVVTSWLAQHQLDKLPRLAQGIEVESGWEKALEKVLGGHLQALCVDQLSKVTTVIDQFKQGSLCVYAQSSKLAKSTANKANADLLLDKVKSKWSLDALLTGIYVAKTQEEALALAQTLESHESVITPEGVWLGANWLSVSCEENPAAGVFQREQELKQLTNDIEQLAEQQQSLEDELQQVRARLKELEQQRDESQKTANQVHAQVTQCDAQRRMKQERLVELQARAERYRQEHEECVEQYEQAKQELSKVRSIWQEAISALEEFAGQREELTQERDSLRERLQEKRIQVNDEKDSMHQLEIQLETTKSQQSVLQQTIVRLQTQLATLTQRKATLQKDAYVGTPLTELEAALTKALSHRLQVEGELNTMRSTIATIEHGLQALDHQHQTVERELAKIRDMLETLRLENQGLKIKSEAVTEQLKETQISLEDILKELPDDVLSDELHQQVDQLAQRIARLGPINLIAIEEYAACCERKDYLDKQNDDLQEGLTTLENAIAKIDKETRARFKETFDKVNERFQELFPKIFGGGRSYLELTGDNLLDAGITVMACPPGKRNSTIHLLSGGEKAMTAIALVFSIFHLNPAPFCLLDEVDAPLDDANIGRFCQLVTTMSEKTQFIFISHNKLAIEMGEHLMGVTMHEPGVSRLVSVNVEEAVNLAGA